MRTLSTTEKWEDAKEHQDDPSAILEQPEEEFVDAQGINEGFNDRISRVDVDLIDCSAKNCLIINPEASQTDVMGDDSADLTLVAGLIVTKEDVEIQLKTAVIQKMEGNKEFGMAKYDAALNAYHEALSSCAEKTALDRIAATEPELAVRVNQERAIIYANMAAAYMKQEKWDQAVSHATRSIESDDKYLKAYVRRSQAYEKIGDSASLSGALKDYQVIVTLDSTNLYAVTAIRRLPVEIQTKQDQEKEEMMAKLKDVGNKLLGKFGLSTDNFQFVKDPSTGGYSMNFKQ